VSAQHKLNRKPPSKLTLTIAGVTATASVAVAAGILTATPGASAGQAAFLRTAHSQRAQRAASAGLAPDAMYGRSLADSRSKLGAQEMRRKAKRAAERQAARRRAARRRAAARRAAAEAAARQQASSQSGGGSAPAAAQPSGSPQQIAEGMLGSYGWSSGEFGCLQSLWDQESGWNVYASNPSSGAYGIPQALPGSKMASAGPGWQSDAATQIRWGLGYIKATYGSPCAAWSHEEATGWY
jgi:hypothetical protein